MNTEYAVALDGHPIDLGDLRDIFKDGPIRVTEIEVPSDLRITVLMAEEFDSLASDTQVPDVARRLLTQINGALFASDTDRSVVRSGAIYMRNAEDGWRLGPIYGALNAKMAPMRGRGRVIVCEPDGTVAPPAEVCPRQIRWLELASTNTPDGDRVADVLHALSREPDWFDLWKAEEIFYKDRKHISDWSADEIERFCKTATLYRHSSSYRGKNGKTAGEWFEAAQKPKMDLETARRLIGRVAARWLDWMVTRRVI